MADIEYGPVELFLIGFTGERPGPEVVDEILKLVQADTVRLLDLLFVSRADDGDLTVLELDEVADRFGLTGIEVVELGLAGEEDVDDLADAVQPGTSAALLVIEHVWAREFAAALYRAGGQVLQTERIPAPVVNELVAATAE
ncbi:DUF6325 family protein [Leifsonia sp. NPDC058230]|uniref:DUF6325 family protein n=1 Tax=Leifsonia sp. NPDC058230 TaxID=3346391 RepID=UPI0036DF8572